MATTISVVLGEFFPLECQLYFCGHLQVLTLAEDDPMLSTSVLCISVKFGQLILPGHMFSALREVISK